MRSLGVAPQYVLQDLPCFREAPTTDFHGPAFHPYFNDQYVRESQRVQGAQASLNFLPELSLCQTVNTGEKLLRIWRSLCLWQAGKEFTAMTQGHSGLFITGMRLAQALPALGREVELTTLFIHPPQESHG